MTKAQRALLVLHYQEAGEGYRWSKTAGETRVYKRLASMILVYEGRLNGRSEWEYKLTEEGLKLAKRFLEEDERAA